VEAGPVVFRDGDVYGRTVNIASRIADEAGAGEVLTSQETAARTEDGVVRFERSRSTQLKGVAVPMTLYRASRGS
jgi:adenylate cyclase